MIIRYRDGERKKEIINYELTITNEKGLHYSGIQELAGQPMRGFRSEALKNHVLIKTVLAWKT